MRRRGYISQNYKLADFSSNLKFPTETQSVKHDCKRFCNIFFRYDLTAHYGAENLVQVIKLVRM